MAADAHRIAPVPCDKFLFFVFLTEALKKNKVCPVVEKIPPNSQTFVSIQTVSFTIYTHKFGKVCTVEVGG
jgi:hypothetical protein